MCGMLYSGDGIEREIRQKEKKIKGGEKEMKDNVPKLRM